MRHMISTLACLTLAAACAKSGDKADSSAGSVTTNTAATTATTSPSAPGIARNTLAGTWHIVARPTSGKDTAATLATLTATGDTAGWTMTLGKAKPVPLHVSVSGDSVMDVSDPYPSARRKGVMVHTTSVFHMQDGKLIGTTVAHYNVKTADSVLTLRTEATKAP